MELQWADIFILAVIGISALLSLFRGLIREVLSLVAWLVAGWVAFKFAGPLSDHLINVVSLPSVRMALAFIGLLLAVLMVFGVLNLLISKLIESTGLSATDRMLGVIFGLGRGIAIITVLVMLAGLTPIPQDPWWRESLFLRHFEQLARLSIRWLPPKFGKHFEYDPGTLQKLGVPSSS